MLNLARHQKLFEFCRHRIGTVWDVQVANHEHELLE